MTCIQFVPQLFDLGGVPVCWDTDVQCPVQDPTVGGTNQYCSGSDVFQNAQGDTYYRVSIPDGAVYALNSVTPHSQQGTQAVGSQQQVSRASSPSQNNPQSPNNPLVGGGSPVHSGASGSQTLTTTTNTPGAAAGAAVVGTAGGFGGFLTGQFCFSGLGSGQRQCVPNWAWLGGGLALLMLVNRGGRRGRLI